MARTNNIKEQQEISIDELKKKLINERIVEERNNRIYLTKIGKIALGEIDNFSAVRSDIFNPYLEARNEWDERMGYSVARETTWRKVAFFLMAIFGIQTIGYVYTATRSHIEPYLIAIDALGTLTPLGVPHKLKTNQGSVEQQMLIYITALRSFSIDKGVNDKNIDIVTAMTSSSAMGKVSDLMLAQSEDPKPTTVQITNIQPIPNSNSFQIDFIETPTDTIDTTSNKKYWRALVTVKEGKTPDDPVQVPNNPLGLSIIEITVTQRVKYQCINFTVI